MLRAYLKRLKKRFARVTTDHQLPKNLLGRRQRTSLGVEQLEDRLTPAQLALVAAALPVDTAGQNYSNTFHTTGGDGHLSFALASGALPKGLSLTSAGVLSGQTTVAGSFAFSVKVTDATISGSSATESCTLTVNPAVAATFTVTAPATVGAGSAFSVTLTAKDAYGNTATGYTGNVAMTASDGQSLHLAAAPAFHSGSATASVTLDTADTLTLTVNSAAMKATGGSIAVSPGAASSFLVTAPATVTAGAGFNVTVSAVDTFGNAATAFASTVTLSSSDGQIIHLGTSSASHNGAATATLTLNTADTLTLKATFGTVKGSSGNITVNPAAAAALVVTEPGTATAGAGFSVAVTAKDAFGNTATGFSGNVALTGSDGQTVQVVATPAFHNGTATATVTLDTADTLTLTATSAALKGTGGTIAVSAGAAATFTVAAPSTAMTGTSFTVTLTARDAFGNTAGGFSGTVAMTSSDGQSVQMATAPTFHNGAATATITLNKADTLTLTATSGTIKGTSGSIKVSSPTTPDWFSQNMTDPGLQAVARTDFARDGALTYSDMLDLFAKTESAGLLTAAEMQSLQALVTSSGTAAVAMAASVQSLTYKVVDGDPANAQYQGAALGNLKVGSSAAQLQQLVNKWFLGEDHPTIDTQYISGWGTGSYVLASGNLFGSGGPSYKDVAQGEEGDCWLLSSFGVTAANDSAVISGMFTDDGTAMESGVQVHVWTVRFYDNGAPTYLTVDNYLPAVHGVFAFANLGQSLTSSSNVLWVPLLEKAYAQLGASGWNQRPEANAYASLNGGTAATTLPVITGGLESSGNITSQSGLIAALAAGNLCTLGSESGNTALGIVGGHDYAVLGYNAATQTFTLLNPWGWNNGSGYPGILNLTWAQISANFWVDGDCSSHSA